MAHLQAASVPTSSYMDEERWWAISFLAVAKIIFSQIGEIWHKATKDLFAEERIMSSV